MIIVNILVVETILLPPEKRNDVNVNRAKKLLGVALGNVDRRLLDRDYLTGTFSGADCKSQVVLNNAAYRQA